MGHKEINSFFIFIIIAAFSFIAGAQTDKSEKEQAAKEEADDTKGETEEDDESKEDIKKSEKEGESEKSSETESGTESEEGFSTEDGEDTEAESDKEEDADEESGESSLKLEPLDDIELNMEGLGQMDPEKELEEGILSEKEASQSAIEDWTERDMELLEIHGYFRVRPELYHKFYIRNDEFLFARPPYQRINSMSEYDGSQTGLDCRPNDGGSARKCNPKGTLSGANMRLRLEPTLNVSKEVWVRTQIDFLDNVMMGSSPQVYQYYDRNSTQISTGNVQGFNMGPPEQDMINVRRVWGEVMTPLGRLSFGRMPDHFGLGMLHNAGNGIDQDFGDTVDRLMFAAKINNWLFAPAFDFPNEGPSLTTAAGRPMDMSQLDDAYQLVGIFAYKHDEEDEKSLLKQGDWLINTGLYFNYRFQVLSFEEYQVEEGETEDDLPEWTIDGNHFYRREMWTISPDLWFEFRYKTFHLGLELALIYGKLGNPDSDQADFNRAQPLTLAQWGGVIQVDHGLLSDQLRIGLEMGLANGDKGVEGLNPPSSFAQVNDPADGTFSQFSFNPSYNVDLILYHHILGSVSGTYYFKPWLRYDFLKSAMGKRLWLQFDIVYSRAMFQKSTINNGTGNLGVELDAQLMYISADNFHMGIKYGILFPLRGFKGEYDPDMFDIVDIDPHTDNDLTIPQTLQVLLGISF